VEGNLSRNSRNLAVEIEGESWEGKLVDSLWLIRSSNEMKVPGLEITQEDFEPYYYSAFLQDRVGQS
jgi:hypothetical protein